VQCVILTSWHEEVLPVLSAAGIEANRECPDKGTAIALRKTPTSNDSNASTDERGVDKGETARKRDGANASPIARDEPNASEDAAETAFWQHQHYRQ
jgi:hypothetical protein